VTTPGTAIRFEPDCLVDPEGNAHPIEEGWKVKLLCVAKRIPGGEPVLSKTVDAIKGDLEGGDCFSVEDFSDIFAGIIEALAGADDE